MSCPSNSDRLFDVVPLAADAEQKRATWESEHELYLRMADTARQEVTRWTAIGYALRTFADDARAGALVYRLTENGWSGTGEQLADVVRSLLDHDAPPDHGEPKSC